MKKVGCTQGGWVAWGVLDLEGLCDVLAFGCQGMDALTLSQNVFISLEVIGCLDFGYVNEIS